MLAPEYMGSDIGKRERRRQVAPKCASLSPSHCSSINPGNIEWNKPPFCVRMTGGIEILSAGIAGSAHSPLLEAPQYKMLPLSPTYVK